MNELVGPVLWDILLRIVQANCSQRVYNGGWSQEAFPVGSREALVGRHEAIRIESFNPQGTSDVESPTQNHDVKLNCLLLR